MRGRPDWSPAGWAVAVIGGANGIAVGSDSNTSYFVALTPYNAGSVIKVMRPANAPDDPPEPEMRFDIARCATS